MPARAVDAFRLDAVDYLLKPLDPDQIAVAVNRLLAHLRPFESGSVGGSIDRVNGITRPDKLELTGLANELLPVKDVDRDQIRLLSRYEIAAVLRRERRSWVHTVREEFATYYPLGDLVRWLGGDPLSRSADMRWSICVLSKRSITMVTDFTGCGCATGWEQKSRLRGRALCAWQRY
jgi:hypothetical protein